MQVYEPVTYLTEYAQRFIDFKLSTFNYHILQRSTFNVFQNQECRLSILRKAIVDCFDNVRMVKFKTYLSFSPEPSKLGIISYELVVKDFQSNFFVKVDVFGEVNFSHASPAEVSLDGILSAVNGQTCPPEGCLSQIIV
jgi:hypothetical protein